MASSVAAILAINPATAQVVSPGELSRAHASLDGSGQCDACHGSRARVEPARCLACHEVLARRIKGRDGYHASLGTSRCGKCHQEHQGRSFDIIRWPTGTVDQFPHTRAGYPLRAKHVGPVCRDCHTPANQRDPGVRKFDPARRKRTWLGLSAAECDSCHTDAHDGELGARCQQCHDETRFDKAPGFDHAKTDFRLGGAHAKVDCEDCHKSPATKDAQGHAKRRFEIARSERCEGCHEDPHGGAMTPSRARLGLTCESCHDDTKWQKIRYPRANHSPRRMPLIGGHGQLACVKCHGDRAARTPRPTCDSCHHDIHQGKFGRDCRSCHGFSNWTARSPGSAPPPRDVDAIERAERLGIGKRELARVAFHDKTQYPLTGLHVTVACAKCHPTKRGRNYKKRFVGLAHDGCDDCHADQHQGQLARDGKAAPTCATCHTTDGWPLTRYGVGEHDGSRFALRGAHRATPCDGCHPSSRAKAERFTYAARECTDCHTDPHQGQFGGASCADCHGDRGFVPARFDHGATRLPLAGAHAATACASCHPKDPDGIARYRGVDPSCASCHRDQHEGQFTRPPRRDCGDCHDVTRFEVDQFDHNASTRYPLTGAHAAATCASCHHPVNLSDGRQIALYRLPDTSCTGCHREQHRASRRGRRTALGNAGGTALDDCQRCHRTSGWRALTTPTDFDHGAVGYPLRGGHRGASCADCHRAARPVSRACEACHADHHGGRLGSACAECHTPESWQPSEMLARHARTRLPLTGGHALADCTSCHPRARGQQFVAVPVDCVACHADNYAAPTTHPDHVASGYSRECEQCHRPASWSPAFFAHTSFPLEGKHRTATCNDCHDRNPVPRDCVGCHAGDRPTGTAPDHNAPGFPVDCGLCHNSSGWVPADFPDHEALFPITSGAHSRFDCADCHTDSTDLGVFTCTTSSCHPRGETDEHHDEVGGYSFESNACYNCHPRGRH